MSDCRIHVAGRFAAFALAVVAGCAAPPPLIPLYHLPASKVEQGHRVPVDPVYAIAYSEAAEKATFFKDVVVPEVRQAYREQVVAAHEVLVANAGTVLAGLREQATKYSYWNLGFGLSGVAAGVGAAVLVAASPANAAFVAGLTSYTSGVVGFQTMVANEGFSREAIANVHAATLKKLDAAETAFQSAFTQLVVTAEDPAWDTGVLQVQSALMQLRNVAAFVPMAEVAPKDPPKNGGT